MSQKKKPELTNASKVLQSLLANSKSPLSDGFLRWKLWRFWPQVVGETIASYCEPVGYERGKLLVWVKSSARMQEIRFFEADLVKKVNEYTGKSWVRSVRFTLDRHSVPKSGEVSGDFKRFLDQDNE